MLYSIAEEYGIDTSTPDKSLIRSWFAEIYNGFVDKTYLPAESETRYSPEGAAYLYAKNELFPEFLQQYFPDNPIVAKSVKQRLTCGKLIASGWKNVPR